VHFGRRKKEERREGGREGGREEREHTHLCTIA